MAYEVLARKWRPQQFDQVVGQGHVTQTLQNAIETERVAHAYLFVGPRGVGKTSIARIMAKALNCSKNRKGVPCDTCDSCKEITAGNNLDVMEIDGASNNGVDNIRDLRDNVKFLPARGPYRVYIIDEVHMLSPGAFNALLKTLEEPPPHVKFIFATTEPQKVPATILSRCQRFDLRRISTGDIAAHLTKIAKAEEVTIDEDAVFALARGAEGGLRDAESAMDQVISFRGKTITEEDVLSVFGLVSRRQLEALCAAIIDGNVPEILKVVAELDGMGKDLQRLAAEVMDYFRHLLVMSYAPETLSQQEIPEHQWNLFKEQAAKADPGRLTRVMDQLIAAQGQLRFALSRRIVLEMAFIRAARAAHVATLDEVIAALKSEAGIEDDEAPEPVRSAPSASSRPVMRETPPPPPPVQKKTSEPVTPVTTAPVSGSADEDQGELAMLTNHWTDICQKVGAMAPLVRSYVRDTRPVAISDVECVIGCDPEFAGNVPLLKHAKCSMALQQAIAHVIGRKVTIHIRELAPDESSKLPADHTVEETRAGDTAAGETSEGSVSPTSMSEGQIKRKWAEEPSVKNVMELFNGRISDIRE